MSTAQHVGVSRSRLNRDDLHRPFHGLRSRAGADLVDPEDPYERQALHRRLRAEAYSPRLAPGQFLSHESAAALWGAPLPLAWISDPDDASRPDRIAHGSELPVHVSTFGTSPLVRTAGVIPHRARPRTTATTTIDGMPVSTAASTWASLGALSLIDIVAAGDYFCRVWRPGPGRPNAGMPPIATPADMQRAIDSGRRVGIRRLREAIDLIRLDSWSPRESAVRCHIVLSGLPEPELNYDVFDEAGRFLACVDLAYPARKVAIEYQSVMHSQRYAADVERIAALRAAGWIVIEVTSALLATPDRLVDRIRAALRR